MKRHFLVFILLLFVCLSAMAQIPQYYVGGATASGNSFPFGNLGGVGSKVQLLYTPADFQTLPPNGTITNVYFRAYNATGYNGINNYVNLEIKMGPTNLTTLTAGVNPFITPLQTVFFASSYSINFTQAQWFLPIVLSTPYAFSNAQNLIVEVSVTSASATKYIAYTTATGIRRTWGTAGGATTTNGDAGLYDIGFDIMTGPPCPAPTGLAATNVLSTSADLSWSAVAGSTGYDYLVDQNPTPVYPNSPTTITGTTFNKTGLTTSTNYYLHVRNRCSPTNFSPWVNLPFTTLPPCKPPIGFNTTNLAYNFATINWSAWPSAISYDYVVDQTRPDPIGTTGSINTTATSANISPLTENTWYYVHIRSKCAGNEISNWSLDSFLTPIICRPPELKIDHINVDEAVSYWGAIPTAFEYEYAITQSATPPALGTKYQYTSIHTSALKDGIDYYIHVRSHCLSVGVTSTSSWATASFKTFALGVNDTYHTDLRLTCYPNPVKDMLRISLTGKRDGISSLQLTDVSGRILHNVNITTDELTIDMSKLAPGMYLLKYIDEARIKVMAVNKQ